MLRNVSDGGRKKMIGIYLWIVSLMFIGACLLFWRKKRKFDRSNDHGIEVFENYPKKFKADTFDKLILWTGWTCIIISFFLFVTKAT